MKKSPIFLLILIFFACKSGFLKIKADLPKSLNEVSGTEKTPKSDLIWMLNDSGNKPKLYGINKKGDIITKLNINAKNNDWEDLAADTDGNIYIGDFGNNEGKRKDLSILKVSASHLDQENEVDIERITFKYENQEKFPPKNKNMYFDCEAFFYFNNNLYLFTKSRVKGDHGKTNMYKVPAKAGNHVAKLVESFTTCEDASCWVTAADISDDGKQVALLTQNGVWLFSNFSTDNFFSGTLKTYPFKNYTQKEGVCFKDNNTLYITDEKAHGEGGNLYEMSLN
ncbi:hypothetical protein [Postechiella marina]